MEAKKGITSASQCEGDKAAFTLTGKLAVLVFNIKIQAQRGGGVRVVRSYIEGHEACSEGFQNRSF